MSFSSDCKRRILEELPDGESPPNQLDWRYSISSSALCHLQVPRYEDAAVTGVCPETQGDSRGVAPLSRPVRRLALYVCGCSGLAISRMR